MSDPKELDLFLDHWTRGAPADYRGRVKEQAADCLARGIATVQLVEAWAAWQASRAGAELTYDQIYDIVRGTGYVTRGQADEITDLLLAAMRKATGTAPPPTEEEEG
jgi:hypothetical protein